MEHRAPSRSPRPSHNGGASPGKALNKFLNRNKVFNGRDKKQAQFYENAKKVARFERMMKHETKAGNIAPGLDLNEILENDRRLKEELTRKVSKTDLGSNSRPRTATQRRSQSPHHHNNDDDDDDGEHESDAVAVHPFLRAAPATRPASAPSSERTSLQGGARSRPDGFARVPQGSSSTANLDDEQRAMRRMQAFDDDSEASDPEESEETSQPRFQSQSSAPSAFGASQKMHYGPAKRDRNAPRPQPYLKERLAYEEKRAAAESARAEAERARAEREAQLKLSIQRRKTQTLQLKERTKRGQPVMSNMIDRMLGKLQSMPNFSAK